MQSSGPIFFCGGVDRSVAPAREKFWGAPRCNPLQHSATRCNDSAVVAEVLHLALRPAALSDPPPPKLRRTLWMNRVIGMMITGHDNGVNKITKIFSVEEEKRGNNRDQPRGG